MPCPRQEWWSFVGSPAQTHVNNGKRGYRAYTVSSVASAASGDPSAAAWWDHIAALPLWVVRQRWWRTAIGRGRSAADRRGRRYRILKQLLESEKYCEIPLNCQKNCGTTHHWKSKTSNKMLTITVIHLRVNKFRQWKWWRCIKAMTRQAPERVPSSMLHSVVGNHPPGSVISAPVNHSLSSAVQIPDNNNTQQ